MDDSIYWRTKHGRISPGVPKIEILPSPTPMQATGDESDEFSYDYV